MNNILKDFLIILGISILLLFVTNSLSDSTISYSELEEINNEEILDKEIILNMEFGLPIDSFEITKKRVKRNQNLSDILIQYGVSYNYIDQLVTKSTPIFNVRKIKAGNWYSVLCNKDSIGEIAYFIYEVNPLTYIKYSFKDSITVSKEEKEITKVTQYTSGVIESSLWNALNYSETNPMLAIELSEIYAWSIDFFGIQKGDNFKVIYEEEFVDSISIGISKVHSACFTHFGKDYWAFEFMEDSIISFFDDEGNSLRKAFLKSPLRYSRISSNFSNSRMHPVLKIRRPHHGIDYAAATGTPVHSIGDGIVIKKGYQRTGGGRYVKIKHNSVYTTVYMHFSKFGAGISTGTRVTQGQIIGYVGKSGLATGPHLDFRVYMNGKAIDPLKLKSPPVSPIHKDNLEKYLEYIEDVKSEYCFLDKLQSV